MRRPRPAEPRRGLASLEFVLALPFLLGMTAIIVSTAYLNLGRTAATVQARHESWKARATSLPQEAAPLPTQPGVEVILQDPLNTRPGVSTQTATKRVRPIPVLRVTELTAEARHTVLGGAWDHRAIDFSDGSHLVPNDRMFVYARSPFDRGMFAAANSVDVLLQQAGVAGGGLPFDPRTAGQQLQPILQTATDLKRSVDDLLGTVKDLRKATDALAKADVVGTIKNLTNTVTSLRKTATGLLRDVISLGEQLGNTPQLTDLLRQSQAGLNRVPGGGQGAAGIGNLLGERGSSLAALNAFAPTNPLTAISNVSAVTQALQRWDKLGGDFTNFGRSLEDLIRGEEY